MKRNVFEIAKIIFTFAHALKTENEIFKKSISGENNKNTQREKTR